MVGLIIREGELLWRVDYLGVALGTTCLSQCQCEEVCVSAFS